MKTMTIERINELQADYGLTETQNQMNSGMIWKFEGSIGRIASNMLEIGILVLPEKRTSDYWGNIIPSRADVKAGTKGSLELAQKFWTEVKNGNLNAIECVERYEDFL